MSAANSKPDIFGYLDFRIYLTDMLAYFRNEDPDFTFQKLVDRYGLASRSHFLDILNGRKLTGKFLQIYKDICGLEGKEADYFELLVFYSQARLPDKKRAFFEQIVELAPNLKTVKLENEVYDYFKEWYFPAMLSLLDVVPQEKDHHLLAKMLKPAISAVQARSALKKLQELGFISWDEAGRKWIFHQKFFKCTEEARAAALSHYHKQMLLLGQQAYSSDFREQSLSTLTVSVSKSLRDEIDSMVADLRRKIMDKVKADANSDQVIQVNFQIFNLSQNSGKQEEDL